MNKELNLEALCTNAEQHATLISSLAVFADKKAVKKVFKCSEDRQNSVLFFSHSDRACLLCSFFKTATHYCLRNSSLISTYNWHVLDIEVMIRRPFRNAPVPPPTRRTLCWTDIQKRNCQTRLDSRTYACRAGKRVLKQSHKIFTAFGVSSAVLTFNLFCFFFSAENGNTHPKRSGNATLSEVQ